MDPSNPPAPRLEPVLRRLRQRIRRVLATRGALITVVTALAGLGRTRRVLIGKEHESDEEWG